MSETILGLIGSIACMVAGAYLLRSGLAQLGFYGPPEHPVNPPRDLSIPPSRDRR